MMQTENGHMRSWVLMPFDNGESREAPLHLPLAHR